MPLCVVMSRISAIKRRPSTVSSTLTWISTGNVLPSLRRWRPSNCSPLPADSSRHNWKPLGGVVRHLDVGDAHREQFRAGVPQRSARGGVDIHHPSVHVVDERGVAGLVEKLAKMVLAAAAFAVGELTLADFRVKRAVDLAQLDGALRDPRFDGLIYLLERPVLDKEGGFGLLTGGDLGAQDEFVDHTARPDRTEFCIGARRTDAAAGRSRTTSRALARPGRAGGAPA